MPSFPRAPGTLPLIYARAQHTAASLLFFVQFEGAMALLEKPSAHRGPTRATAEETAASVRATVPTTGRSAAAMTSAPPPESIADEEGLAVRTAETKGLDVTAAAAAKPLKARTSAGAEGGVECEGEGEGEENDADVEDGEDGDSDEGDSGGVAHVPAPTRLPTPP